MNHEFCNALLAEKKNESIPDDFDWFGPLIGEWDFMWTTSVGQENEKTEKGEWIFSRILNGCGIQDLFIIPPRKECVRLGIPNTEYGTTIRTFNIFNKGWEVYYTAMGEYTRLSARKLGDKIELTEEHGKMKWVFSEIEENSFHWQNIMQNQEDEWKVVCDCKATRKLEVESEK